MEQTQLFDDLPSVSIIDYTGKGRKDEKFHAADILLFSKSTRLNMDADGLSDIKAMPVKAKIEELHAVARTIPSSWEFIDVTFLLSGVSRACAQQITRTRNASYAMQSQRVVDVSAAGVRNPVKGEMRDAFAYAAESAVNSYTTLVEAGMSLEDARGLLPMNIKCNLLAKYNFRSLVDLIRARSSMRTQDEYAEIVSQMKAAVLQVWPWADAFFLEPQEQAISILTAVAERMQMTTGKGDAWEIAKAIDLIRKAR